LEVVAPATIYWEFSVKKHDIKFSLLKETDGIVETVIEPQVVEASEKRTTGSHIVLPETLGKYTIVWDNSYSYWRSKNIFFLVNVVNIEMK
jgi:hypothetical protein